MKKALEILKELHNKDIWVMQQLKLEHIQVYEAIVELEQNINCKNCDNCKHLDENTTNHEFNGDTTKTFCILFGLTKYDRPFKYCDSHEYKDSK